MDQDFYIQLIYQSFKGELTVAQQQQLDTWLEQSPENSTLLSRLQQEWELSKQYEPDIEIDVKGDFQLLRQRIQQAKPTPHSSPLRVIRRGWIGIAASVVLLLALAWWLWPTTLPSSVMATASTGANETRAITLADGTLVWLNSNSTLSFPETFTQQERRVALVGEGFFEVAKNTALPFHINTNDIEITVLGTSFQVDAQADSIIKIQVSTGKVLVSTQAKDQQLTLEKDQAAQWSSTTQELERIAINSNDYAWQSQILRFDQTPLKDVVNDIARYFNVSISLENKQLENCSFGGYFPNPDLIEILDALKESYALDWQQTDQHYQLYNGSCQ